MHKVLVTGASGFVGRTIATQLSRQCDVVATGRRANVDLPATYIPVDLARHELGDRFPDNIDAVIHAAGLTGTAAQPGASNLELTRKVVDWAIAGGVRNLIVISTAAVYAPSDEPQQESATCRPASPYGKDKLDAEEYAIRATAATSLRLAILRFPAVIGPVAYGSFSRLIIALMRRRFVMIGKGDNNKSLISVADVAGACTATLDYLDAAPGGDDPHIFNVSGGEMSVRAIIATCCAELHRKPPIRVPRNLVLRPLKLLHAASFGAGPVAKLHAAIGTLLRNDVLDATRFRDLTGFAPGESVEQTLRDMVRYHIEHG